MLCTINIKNFALIDEVELEFGDGLNILTGETGAGKSIIIGAVSLLLGGRASSDFIRTGEETAEVTGIFDVSKNQGALNQLQLLDMEPESDGTLIIQREISLSGRNKCRINGKIVPLSNLSSLAPYFIDIYGQHEHQSLSNSSRHLEFLDTFGKEELAPVRVQVKKLYKEFSSTKKRLNELQTSEEERRRREDFLKFQIEEIDALNLTPGEDDILERERKVLASSEELFLFASTAHETISQGESASPAILDVLSPFLKELGQLIKVDPSLGECHRLLETAFYHLQEASHQFRLYRDSVSFDSDRLAEIQARLDHIFRLSFKYGGSVNEILDYRKRIGEEYKSLTANEEEILRLTKVKQELGKELIEAAELLSDIRKKIAKDIEVKVMRELADLNMDKTVFFVHFSKDKDPEGILYQGERVKITREGIDVVEFLISPNPGEELKPLAKIASGGELSRLMLALKTILATADNVPTLIFDEIDAGIGGRTADSVAVKLADLSRVRQVICITHLSQIAARADSHYLIEKEIVDNRTRTSISEISGDLRVEELARMLGGQHISETTRKQAKEMIERSKRVS